MNNLPEADIEILIVEDSETQANQLAHLFSSNGYQVRVANNGRRGLEQARAKKPTLIVSDIAMPEMDGFAMCRELKKDEALQDVPVILLTALSSLYDVIKGLDCGADNFIRKPFEERYLLSRIRFILANRDLRSNERVQLGMRINLGGQTHFVTAERQQIFDLLISTYEEAIQMTEELKAQQRQIAHSYQSIEGLYQIAATLNPAITINEVAEKALDRALELPGVLGGCIKLIDGNANFSIVSELDFCATEDSSSLFCAEKCEEMLRNGSLRSAQFISDCPVHTTSADSRSPKTGHICIPLIVGERHLGILNLRTDLQMPPVEEDFQVLNTVGSQIAVALERANLYANMEALVNERTEALQNERNLSSAVVNTTGALVLMVDLEGRIAMFNPACESTLGYRFEDVRGRLFWELFMQPEYAEIAESFFKKREFDEFPAQIPSEWIARDGGKRKIIWSTTFIKKSDQSIEYLLATGIDVTELQNAEEKVRYLSNFDRLTGLPNRFLLRDSIKFLQERASANKDVMGFFAIDFARLALIRESLGAKAEQALLVQIAERFRVWRKNGDTIARLGDSGFAVVTTTKEATDFSFTARQLLAHFEAPFKYDGQELHLEPSIGISIFPNDGQDFDMLVQCAEVAVRGALESKAAHYKFYTPELNRGANERFKLESALRRAISQNELVLYYQPQVDLRTGKMLGLEALIRWQHPEMGLVPPSRFIGLAEDTGLIVSIGAWVLRTACAQAKELQRAGLGELRVGVNLSARQFMQHDLVQLIRQVLTETELDARFLDIELTESMVMTDVERAIGILNDLRALGVQLSIDDFGTGYSSLSYLKRFPIDVLKIDRSFVREIPGKPNDAAICDAIISMAHSLGIKVIAEGVETEEQCAFLSRNMCDEVQGYLFSPPIPAEDIANLLREQRSLPHYLLRLRKSPRTLLLLANDPDTFMELNQLLRQEDYQVFSASGSQEGLNLLAKKKIDVIVSDQRLSDTTGVDFLRAVKIMYPETIGILLSDLAELKPVTDAVNEGTIYKFLTKPCNGQQLIRHIAEAFECKEMAVENRRLSAELRAANHQFSKVKLESEKQPRQKQQPVTHK